MSFLAPLFLLGALAVAVPIFVHLIQRERRNVVEFPSLMFVQRIPFESVERRRIHNWPLLLLRIAAMIAIIVAFARPFLSVDPVSAAAALTGAREVVILLDRSASMGYGEHFARAQAEARRIVDGLSGEDRATLVLFDDGPEEAVRATTDRGTLLASINNAKVSSGATRFAPALRLAQSKLSMSDLGRREAFLISDFQKTGWARQEEIALPEGATVTPVSVAELETSGVSVTSVALERAVFSGEERVTIRAGLANRGGTTVSKLPVSLEIDGRAVATRQVDLTPNGSGSVTFEPVTVADANMRGVIKAGTDALPQDNQYFFVLSPARPVSVLVVLGDGAPRNAALYLTTALSLGRAPSFQTEVVASARVTQANLDGRSLVIVNDAAISSNLAGWLTSYVERGGGLWLILGERTPTGGDWPLLPGKFGSVVDRSTARGGTLGYLDYSHPVFDEYKDPRNGNFANMRFLRYRSLVPAESDRVLARFDDGGAALVERRVGAGRVAAFTSTVDDNWNNAPTSSMFLPLVHEVSGYLAQHEAPAAWQTVGRMFDLSAAVGSAVREGGAGAGAGPALTRGVVVSPSNEQTTIGEGGAASIALTEQGFYSVRLPGQGDRRPYAVAVNIDPAESDLASLPPAEFLAGITGQGTVAQGQSLDKPELTPADMEKRQSIWWFLLVAGLAALLAEAVLSNRLSKRFNLLTGQRWDQGATGVRS
jgi:hypothetical protein